MIQSVSRVTLDRVRLIESTSLPGECIANNEAMFANNTLCLSGEASSVAMKKSNARHQIRRGKRRLESGKGCFQLCMPKWPTE